jgi:hypothetical protein
MRLPLCIVASAVWLSPSLAWAQSPTREGTAWLHVEGPSDTEVLGRSGRRAEWTPVCRAPCDQELPLAWEYRVRGGGIKASGAFELEAFEGQSVVVHVDPASKGWFIAGVVTMSTAGVAAVASLFLRVLATLGCPSNTCQDQLNNTLAAAEAVSGAVFLSGAVPTFVNLRTTVSQGVGGDLGGAGEPVWRTAGRREVVPFPVGNGATLVTVRF